MLTAFSYIYDATGRKVRKVIRDNLFTQNKVTEYAHGFQYLDNVIQHFPTAEGYVSRLNLRQENGVVALLPSTELPVDFFTYVYNYTDHLGNIRLSYAQDPDTQQLKIVEQNHYYPFGLRHTNYSGGKMQVVKEQEFKRMAPTPEELLSYKYKYNGKEYQDELGLNFYDYGARNYDAALGRWMNIDPLAEKLFDFSPYTYAINNPTYFVDPDGKQIDISLVYKKDKYGNEVKDKEGNRILTNINITITGKVINFSDNDVDMDKAVSDITKSLEEAFSGNMDGVKVNTTANFSVANSMNDVNDSDHLFVLTESIKPQYEKNGQMTGTPFG